MNIQTKMVGSLLALSLIALSPIALAKGDGKSGVSVRCSEYIFYKVTSPGGEGAVCIEDKDVDQGVICSDEKGITAKANCNDGCGKTEREGTCERIDLTPPPPPPPPPAST